MRLCGINKSVEGYGGYCNSSRRNPSTDLLSVYICALDFVSNDRPATQVMRSKRKNAMTTMLAMRREESEEDGGRSARSVKTAMRRRGDGHDDGDCDGDGGGGDDGGEKEGEGEEEDDDDDDEEEEGEEEEERQ